MKIWRAFLKIMLSPYAIIAGMVLGVLTGIFFKNLAVFTKPLGEIYLSLLQMCVIPIMASAILLSIGKLVQSEDARKYILKIIMVFMIFMVSVSVISIAAGVIAKPFLLSDPAIKKTLGKLIVENKDTGSSTDTKSIIREIDSRHYEKAKEKESGLVAFIRSIIPVNIFTSLAQGENLKIIFFTILLGIMMKFVTNKSSDIMMLFFEGCYEAFQKLIKISMYFLPIGLWSLIGSEIAATGFEMVASLIKLVILVHIVSLILFFISTLVVWKYAGGSYSKQFKCLGDVIMVCLGTRSSFAAIPISISGINKALGYVHDMVGLCVPLGVTLCRYGNVMIFSIGAVFAMQLYDFSMSIQNIIIIIITSILASMATSGTPGVVSRTMITLVLAPLGIPAGAIVVMLIALDSLHDPILTLVNVYPNCAVAAIVAQKNNSVPEPENHMSIQSY